MADANPVRCRYSASGHMTHPIQYKLAFRASEPEIMQIIGEHSDGITVAPVGTPDHIAVWCMHQEWRDVVRAARAKGITTVLSYQHGLARVGDEFISHTSPEHWTECPEPDQLQPWQTGFFTREQVENAADAPPGDDSDLT